MSDNSLLAPLGFLLLRDGHAVPLTGISPDEIKAGVKHRVPNPDADPVKHRQTLTAVVKCLGFNGDFGDYIHRAWPEFLAFLKASGCTHRPRYADGEQPGWRPSAMPEGCTHRSGVFPSEHGGCIDLFFRSTLGPARRQLADRVFESALPSPKRVFLGHGIDWRAWDGGDAQFPSKQAILSVGGDPETARSRAHALFNQRLSLGGHWGFLDDSLIWGEVGPITVKVYGPNSPEILASRARIREEVTRAVHAFRAVFDASSAGWVDVLPYNDRLVVLRGHDGAWDVLWRCYRAKEPPKPSDLSAWTRLSLEDLPNVLMSESDIARTLHFRQEVWEEHEAHTAEQAFYERGGSAVQRQLVSESEVRMTWLREHNRLPQVEPVHWTGALPDGFREVLVEGRRLAVSDLVTLGEFRQMQAETNYLERRDPNDESWERANEGVSDDAPVGGSWSDAQAYCAWQEQKLGGRVRLPRKSELRSLRPFYSDHYERLSQLDFPWENRQPRPLGGGKWEHADDRPKVPTAVSWSEPRFSDLSGQRPDANAPSAKRWIKDFPPGAAWRQPLPWADHKGLHFIDAWDVYEWCHEKSQVSGRFWEGPLGGWGAYKNAKVTFRIVLDLGE